MSLKRMIKSAAGAALLALSFALPANAATLTFYNDGLTPAGERFSIECSGSCTAWDGGNFAGTDGDLFSLANNSEALELATVNSVTGETFNSLTKTQYGTSNAMFTSSAEYILIKIGQTPNVGIIQNLTADNKFTFTQIGSGAGLSHTSEFGKTTTVVPLPAAGFLLLSAVGLLGFSRRRKA